MIHINTTDCEPVTEKNMLQYYFIRYFIYRKKVSSEDFRTWLYKKKKYIDVSIKNCVGRLFLDKKFRSTFKPVSYNKSSLSTRRGGSTYIWERI